MAYERMPLSFLTKTLTAIKAGDLDSFCSLVGNEKIKCSQEELISLIDYIDPETGENIYHYLLDKKKYPVSRKKHRNKIEICHLLLTLSNNTSPLNTLDNLHISPFHIAIQQGYTSLIETFLAADTDISQEGNQQLSYLELAAKYKKAHIYKLLLKKHTEINKKANEPKGFNVEQLQNALATHLSNLQFKQKAIGILGAVMAIACPVGAIFAFYELPLLEVLFGALIPGVGPFIGLVGAAMIGGMLLWSMYDKSAMKYGHHAQKMATLDNTLAQINRLEAELRNIEKQLQSHLMTPEGTQGLLRRKETIVNKLTGIYSNIEKVEPRHEAEYKDWATSSDVFRTSMLTFGAFVCSFSGILGILGGLAPYAPAFVATTAVFAGIPVAGWCALGVALLIGAGVAAWAYQAKYKGALEQSGKARQELHEKQVKLCEKRTNFENAREEKLEMKPLSRKLLATSADSYLKNDVEYIKTKPERALTKSTYDISEYSKAALIEKFSIRNAEKKVTEKSFISDINQGLDNVSREISVYS